VAWSLDTAAPAAETSGTVLSPCAAVAAEPSGGRPGVPDRLRRAGEGTSPDCSMSQSNRRKVGLPVSDAMISRLLEPSEFEFGIHLSR
jgi:hypothetical protein